MMSKRIKQSTVEASEWFAAQREGELGRADRERFLDWLRESPVHVAEYLELARLWDEMGEVDALRQVDVKSELAKAEHIVMELGSSGSTKSGGEPTMSPTVARSSAWRAVAAVFVIAVVVTWWTGWFDSASDDIMTTAIGEQRSVTLDDGSVISLNTQTSVRVTFVEGGRRAELLQGEVLFDIVRDEQRPFVVVAGATEVRVLGTTFNVYRQDNQTATVTVLEGRVAVIHNDAANGTTTSTPPSTTEGPGSAIPPEALSSVELTQGQQAHIGRAGAVVEPTTVNVEKAVAWTDRRLIFEDTTLDDVLAEFNRYNRKELEVFDPTLAALRLNGVFESHDPDSLIQYLELAHGVRVRDNGDQRIIEPR